MTNADAELTGSFHHSPVRCCFHPFVSKSGNELKEDFVVAHLLLLGKIELVSSLSDSIRVEFKTFLVLSEPSRRTNAIPKRSDSTVT